MELDDLKGFLAVAKLGHLTAAAQSLGVSQSTLSRRIQRLEAQFRQPLFDRTARAMVLTDAGGRFIDRARLVVSVMEQAAAELSDEPGRGTVRVGAIPTVAPFLIPELLTQFAGAFPDARVSVREETTRALLEACRDGDVDIAILAEPVDATHLEKAVLYDEELLLVMPANHPLAAEPALPIETIEREPMVLLNNEHCLTETVGAFCRERSVQVVGVERVHQLTMLQELVGLGHGVSLVPDLAARRDRAENRVYRRVAPPAPSRRIVALRNPYRFQRGVAVSFWGAIATHARDHVMPLLRNAQRHD